MSKTFVTIFPICENVHLTKDLGQIPYFMHKIYGYDSKIVCYNNSENYSNIEGEVKGLKIDFIKNNGRIRFAERAVLKYICKNAKKINVLNLYIFSKHAFVYGILYKLLNPSGFLFLKLDGYNETFAEGTKVVHSTKKIKNFILKLLEKIFLRKVDLISIENSDGKKLVQTMYPAIADKIIYLPVGVNDFFISKVFDKKLKSYNEKENIILTSGRIGEEIKNHEMILRALTQTNMKNWKMIFAGPVHPHFMDYFHQLILNFPELKSRVIFTGNIHDRAKLYEWYNRSKIFCMTSWKESFCHSIAEALYFGNYIIGTEGIMSMTDITNKGKYGIVLKPNDEKELAHTFQKLIDDEKYIAAIHPEIVTFSHHYFVWSKIVKKINKRIEGK